LSHFIRKGTRNDQGSFQQDRTFLLEGIEDSGRMDKFILLHEESSEAEHEASLFVPLGSLNRAVINRATFNDFDIR
jgi:hypothetical protein